MKHHSHRFGPGTAVNNLGKARCLYALPLLALLVLSLGLTGCLHGRGEHTVPYSRDYQHLEENCVKAVEDDVAKAHRVGAGHFAPYEFHSASHYLDWARHERSENDCKGEADFSNLTENYALQAIEKGAGIEDKGMMPMPENKDACIAEFERLKARYLELDPCKAKLVAPVPYAHIEAQLSIAEHELIEKCHCHYPQAARHLRWVEADIDAIWAKDADKDGVRDMDDGEPWIPEDKDGYEDEDGIPEPKPYPVLSPVLFAVDCAKLSPQAQGYLKGIANMLIDGYSEATVHIIGHTDSDASEEYNMALSKKRVDSVEKALLEYGAKNAMIKSCHKGESQPAVPNDSAAAKAKNRRVEILLDSPDVESPYCR